MNGSSTRHPILVPQSAYHARNHRCRSLPATKHLMDSVRCAVSLIPKIAAPLLLFAANGYSSPQTESRATMDRNGVVHIPAMAIPPSTYMSEEAKRAFIERPYGLLKSLNEHSSLDQQREA